jgi:formate dehydrogenase subunit gamma
MVETTAPSEAPLLRFGRVERRLHWVNATLFFVLMLTGAILYVGPLSALVGRRELIRTIHVYSGVALPVPLLIALIGRHGARLRRDFGQLNRFAPGEARWFRARTRGSVRLGKFNPGQKLNAVFIGAAGLVMLGTGSIMKWFSLFPIDWRTGATFVHDWFALGIWVAVIGHVMFAFKDPIALGGMMRGSVSAAWAREERPRWYEAEIETEIQETIDSERPDTPR